MIIWLDDVSLTNYALFHTTRDNPQPVHYSTLHLSDMNRISTDGCVDGWMTVWVSEWLSEWMYGDVGWEIGEIMCWFLFIYCMKID